MMKFSTELAMKNFRGGRPKNVWAAKGPGAEGDDAEIVKPGMGGARIFTNDLDLRITPKFKISPDERFFAVGSCFARNLELALNAKGLDVRSWRHDMAIRPWWFNRYNTFSMLNDFEMAYANAAPEDGFRQVRGTWFDYFGFGRHTNLQFLIDNKNIVLDTYRRAAGASVVILTLGLAEAWFDKEKDRYLNLTPTEDMLANPERYELHITDFTENMQALERLFAFLRAQLGETVRVICTVSPVPFLTTFSEQDVIVANSYSKSVLRAVAGAFADAHQSIDYFPSYELAMLSDPVAVWENDKRHVRQSFVDRIIATFLSHYIASEPIRLAS